MPESQIKSVCRLNRLLVIALACLTFASFWGEPAWWSKALFISLIIIHFCFLMANESLLRMVKRLRETELQMVEHLTLVLPSAFALYVGINYLFTGDFLTYMAIVFAILEAQFLGQSKLSRALGMFAVAIFLSGAPFGFPHPLVLAFTPMFMVMLGFGTCTYYYGSLVSRLVRSHFSEVGKLQSMAATDVLTGLTNRRQFNNRLHEEVARARRHETPLTLALFDLDDFKRLNDFYGHPVGDRILKELGKTIRQNIRESDLPARYGGEEFALILPETREAEAYELLERLRLLVAQTVFCMPENPLTVTISIGVAQLEPRQHTAFELVELADKALYDAKSQGKNQVVKASTLMSKILMSKSAAKLQF